MLTVDSVDTVETFFLPESYPLSSCILDHLLKQFYYRPKIENLSLLILFLLGAPTRFFRRRPIRPKALLPWIASFRRMCGYFEPLSFFFLACSLATHLLKEMTESVLWIFWGLFGRLSLPIFVLPSGLSKCLQVVYLSHRFVL